ncbi:hypothetical protein RB195_007767 [Necator americanus]|uniref:sn-1-specific diacylglycerol lipase ABHD11 n=1 Tax=Necator americanus TaxID=51031 RepID=A0ABR1C183_NECAM
MASSSQRFLLLERNFCDLRRRFYSGKALELASIRYGDPSKDRERPPLIICHGLFGQKQNWHSVSKAMQRRLGCTIYSLDLRNHGESPWSDSMNYDDMSADVVGFLENLSKEINFRQFHLLGHSMGGRVAMRIAVEASWQRLIDRLIIEDVSPKAYEKEFAAHVTFRKYIHAMAAMDLSKSRREILKELEDIVPDIGVRQFLLTNLTPTHIAGVSRWRCNLQAIDNNLEKLLRFTIPDGTFSGPTLFSYGKNSEYIQEKDQNYIRSIFPKVQFEGIPNAGHWVHAEQPQAFMDSVCKFLA